MTTQPVGQYPNWSEQVQKLFMEAESEDDRPEPEIEVSEAMIDAGMEEVPEEGTVWRSDVAAIYRAMERARRQGHPEKGSK